MLPLHGLLCCKLVLLLSHWANTETEREKETVGCYSSWLGERELLACCAVPRGVLEESPASPTHQGFEVALRVRWRSFMNELSWGLGMNHRHKQAVPFSKSRFVSSFCGPVYRDEGVQRRVPHYIYATHKCDITSAGMWLCPGQALGCSWTSSILALREGEKHHRCIFII